MKPHRYIFESNQIKKETGKLKAYLQEKRFASNTIKPYINYTSYFLNWLEQNRLSPEKTTYNHILKFIDYCRENNKGNRLINRMLSATRHYYNFLSRKKGITNPVTGVYIRGTARTVPCGTVSFEELEETCNLYRAIDNRTKRNKIILGILIYQFPTVEEIKMLQTTDINLQEGKIYIPGGRKSNGRMLELKPFQIIGLNEYLKEIRPGFITPVPTKSSGDQTNQLFISVNGCKDIKNSIHHLFCAIKKINPKVKSPTQVRISVISHLQKSVPLRKLQYMAGHKYISSTERYKQGNMEELYKQLELYHPLN